MKKIGIKHLARVEGHGGITVELEDKEVKKVTVDVFEGPRLLEALAVGQSPSDIASFIPRICAICTVSHKNACLRGVESALAVKEDPKTYLTRELMHLGEMLESHSLHFFALALPDYLGFPSVVAMAEKFGPIVLQALNLKKFGNSLMKLLNGKMIHGENATVGGFGKFPSSEELRVVKKEAESLLAFVQKAVEMLGDYSLPDYLEQDTVFICCNPPKDSFGFWAEELITSEGTVFPALEYREYIAERVVPHSFAKRALYKGKTFMVGALARLNLLGERLTGSAAEFFKKYYNSRWRLNPFYNNLAQGIEMIYGLERIPQLVEEIVPLPDPQRENPTRTEGRGVGSVEAPRGLLLHDYQFKEGQISVLNIITPTAMNLENLESYIRTAANNLNKQEKDIDTISFELEKLARAYDPCISCATHLVKVIKK